MILLKKHFESNELILSDIIVNKTSFPNLYTITDNNQIQIGVSGEGRICGASSMVVSG